MRKTVCFCLIFLFVAIGGCASQEFAESVTSGPLEISPKVESAVTLPPKDSPTKKPENYQEDNLSRAEIIECLSYTPTPYPQEHAITEVADELQTGDIVIMGNYAHGDSDPGYVDGVGMVYSPVSIPIRWIVLEKKEKSVLLLSLYNIDVIEYATGKNADNQWESSTLRRWLNDDFFLIAFTEQEREIVLQTKTSLSGDEADSGEAVLDFVYILSEEEVKTYLPSEIERKTQVMPPIYKEKIDWSADIPQSDTTDYFNWWLRTEGNEPKSTMYVCGFGEIHEEGTTINDSMISVRPAMWIDLEKVKEIGLELEAE